MSNQATRLLEDLRDRYAQEAQEKQNLAKITKGVQAAEVGMQLPFGAAIPLRATLGSNAVRETIEKSITEIIKGKQQFEGNMPNNLSDLANQGYIDLLSAAQDSLQTSLEIDQQLQQLQQDNPHVDIRLYGKVAEIIYAQGNIAGIDQYVQQQFTQGSINEGPLAQAAKSQEELNNTTDANVDIPLNDLSLASNAVVDQFNGFFGIEPSSIQNPFNDLVEAYESGNLEQLGRFEDLINEAHDVVLDLEQEAQQIEVQVNPVPTTVEGVQEYLEEWQNNEIDSPFGSTDGASDRDELIASLDPNDSISDTGLGPRFPGGEDTQNASFTGEEGDPVEIEIIASPTIGALPDVLREYDRDGDGFLSSEEYAQGYSEAGNQAIGGVGNLLNGSNDFAQVVGGLETVAAINNAQQLASQQNGAEVNSWFGEADIDRRVEGGIGALGSGLALDNALDSGNELGAVQAGVGLWEDLDRTFGDGGDLVSSTELFEGVNVGQTFAVLNFASAFNEGDAAGIASAGVQLYTAFGGNAIPYAGAVISLLDGDVEGAAISAASTYLMTLGPWGIAAAVVLSVFGGSKPPPPHAQADFMRDEDGNFFSSVSGNGGGLEAQVGAAGDSVADWLNSFEDRVGLEIDPSLFPSYEMLSTDHGMVSSFNYANAHGGETYNTIPEEIGMGRMIQSHAHTTVGLQMLMNGAAGYDIAGWNEQAWAGGFDERNAFGAVSGANRAQIDQFFASLEVDKSYSVNLFGAPDPSVLNIVRGNGNVHGGGNVGGSTELVIASSEHIKSLGAAPERTVQQEIKETTQRWQLNSSFFSGPQAGLYAAGLAAGTVSIEDLLAAGVLLIDEPLNTDELDAARELILQSLLEAGGDVISVSGETLFENRFENPAHGENLIDEVNVAFNPLLNPRGSDFVTEASAVDFSALSLSTLPFDASGAPIFTAALQPVLNEDDAAAQSIRRLINDPAATSPTPEIDITVLGSPTSANPIEPGQPLDPDEPNFATGESFALLEDRDIYINVNELLVNDGAGSVFVGIQGVGGEVMANSLALAKSSGSAIVTVDNGQVEIITADNGAIELRFIPAANFFGETTIQYVVRSATGEEQVVPLRLIVQNVNDAPDAADDRLTLAEDTIVDLNQLLLNDGDIDAESVSLQAVGQVSHGEVVEVSAGQFEYRPEANYTGPIEFVYVVVDAAGASSVARTTILFTEQENDAAQVQEDVLTGAIEETDYVFNANDLLNNDHDAEGDAFSITQVVANVGGSATWDANTGEVVFTPDVDFHGTAELTYQVTDATGNVSQAKVQIQVANVDDAIAVDSAMSVPQVELAENAATLISASQLLSNIDNPDGDPLTITAVRVNDSNGSVAGYAAVQPNGDVLFTPLASFSGEVTLDVRVSDGDRRIVNEVNLTVPVALTPMNVASVASAVSSSDPLSSHALNSSLPSQNTSSNSLAANPLQTDEFDDAIEDQTYVFAQSTLLANDTGLTAGGSVVSITLRDPAHGEVLWDQTTGVVTVVPTTHFNGRLVLDYAVQDAQTGTVSSSSAAVVFAAVDDSPEIADTAFTLDANEPSILTAQSLVGGLSGVMQDVDGESISLQAVRLIDPAVGSVELLPDGNVLFVPAVDYLGQAQIELTVTDGVSSVQATSTLSIAVINDAPIGQVHRFDDALEDTVYQFNSDALLDGASDEEGDAFSITGIRLVDPSQAELVWNEASGAVSVLPAENFFGEVQLEYVLTDELGAQSVNQASVTFANVNDTASFENVGYRDPAYNLYEDEVRIFTRDALLDGVTHDADGEALVISQVTMQDPSQGTVTVTADGDVRFVPAQDYTGEAAFTVEVSDGVAPTELTVDVRLWPVNDAPEIAAQAATVDEEMTLSLSGSDLLQDANDSEGDELRVVGAWRASNGTVAYDSANDQIRYTPHEDVTGSQWIDYIVEDEHGAWSVARVTVQVDNVIDAAIAEDDALTALEAANASDVTVFNANELLDNDSNVDDLALQIQSIDASGVTHGVVSLQADGSVRYEPEVGYVGTQMFTYTLIDSAGNLSTAAVELRVEDVNAAPVVQPVAVTSVEDETLVLSVNELLENASDVEDDWLHIGGVRTEAKYGDVTFDPETNSYHFKPVEHYNSELYGDAVLEYLVVDEKGGQTWAPVTVNITSVDDVPVANPETLLVWSSGPNLYENEFHQNLLLQNDQEFDGDTLVVESVTQGSVGGVLDFDSASGVLGYTAQTGFIGTDSFSYTVIDEGNPDSHDMATVTVEVVENHAVEANDTFTQTQEDTVLIFGIEDFDVDDADLVNPFGLKEELSIVEVKNPVNGNVSLNANGTVSFVPNADFNGLAMFTYTVRDIVGNESTAEYAIDYTTVNDAPIARDDEIALSIDEDNTSGLRFNPQDFLRNDRDVDDPNTSFGQIVDLQVQGADNGRLLQNSDGTMRYVPNPNFHGTDYIRYEITDGGGLTSEAKVKVTVNSINDRPIVEDDFVEFAGRTGSFAVRDLLRNDSDADGDTLTAHGPNISGGRINIAVNHSGAGSVNYTVSDGHGGTETATLNYVAYNTTPEYTSFQRDTWRTINVYARDDFSSISGGSLIVNAVNHNATKGIESEYHPEGGGYWRFYMNAEARPTSGTKIFITFTLDDDEGGLTTRKVELVDFANLNYDPNDPYYAHFPPSRAPIVLDLNNNGYNLTGYSQNGAHYDIDGDGDIEKVSWIESGDAVLAFDADGDGVINQAEEIVFTGYVEGATTDLEGLRYFDSNEDGVLDAKDEQWGQFGAWQDDGDGLHETGEWLTLTDSGIESINLTRNDEFEDMGDAGYVLGSTEFTYVDGSTGQAGDAVFTYGDTESTDTLINTLPVDGRELVGVLDIDSAIVSANTDDAMVSYASDFNSDRSLTSYGVDDTGSELEVAGRVPAPEPVSNVAMHKADTLDDDWMPKDEEIDRMAMNNNSQVASAPPKVEVAEVDPVAASSGSSVVSAEKQEEPEPPLAIAG